MIIKIFSHRWLYGANSYILSAKHQTDHDAFYQTYTWTKLSISIIWSQSYLRVISHVCFVNCLTMDIYWLLLLYECHKLYQLQEMDYNGVINKNIGLVIMKYRTISLKTIISFETSAVSTKTNVCYFQPYLSKCSKIYGNYR